MSILDLFSKLSKTCEEKIKNIENGGDGAVEYTETTLVVTEGEQKISLKEKTATIEKIPVSAPTSKDLSNFEGDEIALSLADVVKRYVLKSGEEMAGIKFYQFLLLKDNKIVIFLSEREEGRLQKHFYMIYKIDEFKRHYVDVVPEDKAFSLKRTMGYAIPIEVKEFACTPERFDIKSLGLKDIKPNLGAERIYLFSQRKEDPKS